MYHGEQIQRCREEIQKGGEQIQRGDEQLHRGGEEIYRVGEQIQKEVWQNVFEMMIKTESTSARLLLI